MLPGFRLLFATVVLAGAVLIFGLGAAALLRAAHEEFASLPSWRAAAPPLPARIAEPPPPTLALLRVETQEATPDAVKDMTSLVAVDAPAATAEHTAVAPESTEATEPEEMAVPQAVAAETPAPAIVEASLQPAPAGAVAPDTASPEMAPPTPQAAAPDTAIQQPSDGAASPAPETEPKAATVASLPAPAKVGTTAQPGKPAAAKARQAAAKATARRRLIAIRARAAARARALEQQKSKTLDPLAQLFGGA